MRLAFWLMCCITIFFGNDLASMNYSNYTKQNVVTFFGKPADRLHILLNHDEKFYTGEDMKQLARLYPDEAEDFLSMTIERFIPLRIVDEESRTILPCVYLPHTLLLKPKSIIKVFMECQDGGRLMTKDGTVAYLQCRIEENSCLLRDIAQKIELEIAKTIISVSVSTCPSQSYEQLAWKDEMHNARIREVELLKNKLGKAKRAYSDIKCNKDILGILLVIISVLCIGALYGAHSG